MNRISIFAQIAVMMTGCIVIALVVPSPVLAQSGTPVSDAPEAGQVITTLDFETSLILISGTVNVILTAVVGLLLFRMNPAQLDAKVTEELKQRQADEKYIDAWTGVFTDLNETVKMALRVAVKVTGPMAELTPIKADDALIDVVEEVIKEADEESNDAAG